MTGDREPKRTCVGCRGRAPKGSLLRIAVGSGTVRVDPEGIVQGRGAYVHPAPACVQAALERGALTRALRAGLEPTEIARLRTEIEGIQ